MSKFDYRDPGTDARYCNGLSPYPAAPDDAECCAWCGDILPDDKHYPYCCSLCGIHAEQDSAEGK